MEDEINRTSSEQPEVHISTPIISTEVKGVQVDFTPILIRRELSLRLLDVDQIVVIDQPIVDQHEQHILGEIELENEKLKFQLLDINQKVSALEKDKLALANSVKLVEMHNQTLLEQIQLLESMLADLKQQQKADHEQESQILDELFSIRERISYANKTLYARKMTEVLEVSFILFISLFISFSIYDGSFCIQIAIKI